MTNYCSPTNRNFFQPRQKSLAEIIAKYPNESKKERKARDKLERKQLQVGIFPDHKSWFKVSILFVTKQIDPKMVVPRESLLYINADGIRVHDMKTKQRVFFWSLSQVTRWKSTNPKTFTICFSGLQEAILIKSQNEASNIEALLSFHLSKVSAS